MAVSGTEMMINSILRALKIDPELMKGKAVEIGNIIVDFKAQLDRVEANQLLILERLSHGERTNDNHSAQRSLFAPDVEFDEFGGTGGVPR